MKPLTYISYEDLPLEHRLIDTLQAVQIAADLALRAVADALRAGKDPGEILSRWQADDGEAQRYRRQVTAALMHLSQTPEAQPAPCICASVPAISATGDGEGWHVKCSDPECWVGRIRPTRAEAVAAWNTVMGYD